MSSDTALLPPEQLKRYADAIVKAGVSLAPGDTLVIRAEHEHRELTVALAEAGYRAGAVAVEALVQDPLVSRARLKYGRDDALGTITPWAARRIRELGKPTTALVTISGEATPGYLEGIAPARVRTDSVRAARHQAAYRRAAMQMRARWTIAGWPTDHWAGLVYPELEPLKAKRKLARDLLWFCRLTDQDGRGSTGWMRHVRAIDRRAAKLSRLGLDRLELRGPGTALDLRMADGTKWMGGFESTPDGVKLTPNMPTEETFTSPHASGTDGTFMCTFPLSFRGRLIRGLRGEFRNGWLVRLDAAGRKDRDFVAAYLDSDKTGHGRRLGEVALVDATSRIGLSGRTYFDTLLDENASAHIAFGQGFAGARTTKPARGVNNSIIHLDVMIGGPELEVTGVTSKGRRLPLIADGFWQI